MVGEEFLVIRPEESKALRVPVLIGQDAEPPSGYDLVLLSRPAIERASSSGYVLRIGFGTRGPDRVPAYLTHPDTRPMIFERRGAIEMSYMDARIMTDKFESTAREMGEFV